MSLLILGIEFERLLELKLGIGVHLPVSQGPGEAHSCIDILRRHLKRLLVKRNGVCETVGISKEVGQEQEGLQIVRIPGYDRFLGSDDVAVGIDVVLPIAGVIGKQIAKYIRE